jgi:hypothetical protein
VDNFVDSFWATLANACAARLPDFCLFFNHKEKLNKTSKLLTSVKYCTKFDQHQPPRLAIVHKPIPASVSGSKKRPQIRPLLNASNGYNGGPEMPV